MQKTRTEVEVWEHEFNTTNKLKVRLSDDAVVVLAERAEEQSRSVLQVCRDRFKDYQFGLKLIEKNTGQHEFELTAEAVKDPDKFLSQMVVLSYDREAVGKASDANES